MLQFYVKAGVFFTLELLLHFHKVIGSHQVRLFINRLEIRFFRWIPRKKLLLLSSEVLWKSCITLGQKPQTVLTMSTRNRKLEQWVPTFVEGLVGDHVVDDKKRLFAGKTQRQLFDDFEQITLRFNRIDVVVLPYVAPLKVGLVPPQSRTQDDDVIKVTFELLLEEIKNFLSLPQLVGPVNIAVCGIFT